MEKRILWFFILLFVIGLLSLTGAYFIQSSPAWICDFGYAFPKVDGKPDDTNISFFGFIIELGRLILLLTIAYFIYTIVYNEHFKEVVSDIISSQFKLKVYYYALAVLVVLTGVVVVLYHSYWAPEELAGSDSKYWEMVTNDQELQGINDKCWENASDSWVKYKKHTDADTLVSLNTKLKQDGMFEKMYSIPYIWYLPYSLINYVVLLIPVIFLAWFSVKTETSYLIRFVKDFTKKSRQYSYGPANDSSRLIQDMEEMISRFIDYCANHAWLALGAALIAFYELVIGHRTLANAANMFAVIGIISLISFLILLMRISINYQRIHSRAKVILIKHKNQSDANERKVIEKNLEKLKELSIVQQFLQSKETILSIFLVAALYGVILPILMEIL